VTSLFKTLDSVGNKVDLDLDLCVTVDSLTFNVSYKMTINIHQAFNSNAALTN
jgi:hypothetical protein